MHVNYQPAEETAEYRNSRRRCARKATDGAHGAMLAALLLLAATGCSSTHQATAEAATATTAADGTTATVAATDAPQSGDAATSAPDRSAGSGEDKTGAGHISLAGQYTLEKDFTVDGCQVGPPGDGLLSGYHMAAKDESPIALLSVALKDYDKDGPYVQASTSREAAVGQAMKSGIMGPLTMMIMRDATSPLAFMQVPASQLTITVSDNGAKGNAEFTDLESQPSMADFDPKSGGMPKGKRVSGSITWTCGSVDRINAKMNDAVNGAFKQLIPPR